MGRAPCCEKDNVKRGPWTPDEDAKLLSCIAQHGTGSWRTLPKKAGLQRCGKSCRLRWTNYLRPDLKHGRFSDHEEQMIVKLHAALGSRWSLIAAQLPGRTDNDVKNYWNTQLKKKLCEMGIDPITHKPISQLLADLAGSIALPKAGGQRAETPLSCLKDGMLSLLLTQSPEWQLQGSEPSAFQLESVYQRWNSTATTSRAASSYHFCNRTDFIDEKRLQIKDADMPESKPMQVDLSGQKIGFHSNSEELKSMLLHPDPVTAHSYHVHENVARSSDNFIRIQHEFLVDSNGRSVISSLKNDSSLLVENEDIPNAAMCSLLDYNAVEDLCSRPYNSQWTTDAPPEAVVIPRTAQFQEHQLCLDFLQQHDQHYEPSSTNYSYNICQVPGPLHGVQQPPHQQDVSSSIAYWQATHADLSDSSDAIVAATAHLSYSPSGSNTSSCSCSAAGDYCDLSAAAMESVDLISSDMNILWDFSELGSIMS